MITQEFLWMSQDLLRLLRNFLGISQEFLRNYLSRYLGTSANQLELEGTIIRYYFDFEYIILIISLLYANMFIILIISLTKSGLLCILYALHQKDYCTHYFILQAIIRIISFHVYYAYYLNYITIISIILNVLCSLSHLR